MSVMKLTMKYLNTNGEDSRPPPWQPRPAMISDRNARRVAKRRSKWAPLEELAARTARKSEDETK